MNTSELKKVNVDEVYKNDRDHMIHSWSVQSKLNPMVVNEAEGCYFWDGNGKKYLDMAAQLVNQNIGHQHPKVVKAIKDQADKLCFAAPGFANEARSTLAKLLSEVTPEGINHFFFTNGGADANENAIKIARLATGKWKIISRYRSYHGSTYGAIALTGDPRRPPVEPGMPGVVKVYDPYCYRCTFGKEYGKCNMECVKHIEETIMYENPDTVAAIIVESVTGSNGIFIPPKEYFTQLRALCDKYNILLITDEVMSGFGRTGEWFGIDNFGVLPDIMTMAKGINSGYVPLGAVGVSDEVTKKIYDKNLFCGLTYSGHPLACAAAVATITAYREEKVIENAKAQGELLAKFIAEMKEKHRSVGDVRNIGLFGCIELVKNRETKEPIVPWNGSGEAMDRVKKSFMDDGVYMYLRWNYMFIVPPCTISEEEMKEAFLAIDKALTIADGYVEE
ncbi:aminotransferase class III-fold pyridoxal phosphate-dependent enzyme [Clostridium sp. CX1]|uniref:aminotransferase class III-fold pyridoxal phosphate-dependent enzyme n=1 Tax=Clostridium sp. CX1 TaxID=2978346 RepID=UPI0021C0BDBC|nr:aminotransferase class III-fold pyridoxal phosphate-dependent enzyme [Clostridium sp. CX1]MCT8975196.1 aminotransferase class III-fold pyridoxal phosphate-dependent enzyme [Clostridium sp. CX1]